MALTDNLISYWKLDESSGNATDAHGSNTLTDNGSVGTAAGILNTARDFDGSTKYLSRTGNPLNGASALSVQAWVKNTRGSTSFRPDMIYASYDSGGGGDGVQLGLDGDAGAAKFRFRKFEAFAAGTATADAGASVNTWYHLVGTISSGGVVTLYVNGTVQATTGSTSGTLGNTTDTFVGAAQDLGASSFWQGPIDELGIWSRELTPAEVTQLYNGGAGLAYPFATAHNLHGATNVSIGGFTVSDQPSVGGFLAL